MKYNRTQFNAKVYFGECPKTGANEPNLVTTHSSVVFVALTWSAYDCLFIFHPCLDCQI